MCSLWQVPAFMSGLLAFFCKRLMSSKTHLYWPLITFWRGGMSQSGQESQSSKIGCCIWCLYLHMVGLVCLIGCKSSFHISMLGTTLVWVRFMTFATGQFGARVAADRSVQAALQAIRHHGDRDIINPAAECHRSSLCFAFKSNFAIQCPYAKACSCRAERTVAKGQKAAGAEGSCAALKSKSNGPCCCIFMHMV